MILLQFLGDPYRRTEEYMLSGGVYRTQQTGMPEGIENLIE